MPPMGGAPTLVAANEEMNRTYRRGLWWARERHRLATLAVVALFLVEGAMVLAGLFSFLDYYVIRYPAERALVLAFAPDTSLEQAVSSQAPSAVRVGEATLFASAGARYDAMAMAVNPSTQWIAHVHYTWKWDTGESSPQVADMLPGEERPLLLFGIEGSRPRGMGVQVQEVKWERVPASVASNPVNFVQAHVNMKTTDIVHDAALKVGEKTIGRTSFTLTNQTGYAYRDVLVLIVAKRGNTAVGVHQASVSSFLPHESRVVQVDWFGTVPGATTASTYPVVNVFRADAYMPQGDTPSTDRRDTPSGRRL